jgi:hypothetical protein
MEVWVSPTNYVGDVKRNKYLPTLVDQNSQSFNLYPFTDWAVAVLMLTTETRSKKSNRCLTYCSSHDNQTHFRRHRTSHTARCQVRVWKMFTAVRTQIFPTLLILGDKESYSGCSVLNILVWFFLYDRNALPIYVLSLTPSL